MQAKRGPNARRRTAAEHGGECGSRVQVHGGSAARECVSRSRHASGVRVPERTHPDAAWGRYHPAEPVSSSGVLEAGGGAEACSAAGMAGTVRWQAWR